MLPICQRGGVCPCTVNGENLALVTGVTGIGVGAIGVPQAPAGSMLGVPVT